MFPRVRASSIAALCVLGCAANPGVESRAVVRASSAPATETLAKPNDAPPVASSVESSAPIRLEPLPLVGRIEAAFRITSPAAGERILSDVVATRSVVVSGAQGTVYVGLDDHPFRRVDTGSIRLMDLLLEDEELAPGAHRLVVVQEGAEGRAIAASWFFVGDEGEANAEPSSWGAVLFSPHGTFNGDAAADGVTIDAFSLTPERSLVVRVVGPGWTAERRTSGEPLTVQGLPSGDFRIEAEELAPGPSASDLVPVRGAWSTLSRVITVNRDAPRRPGP